MENQFSPALPSNADSQPQIRKPWRKPEAALLPVNKTRHHFSTGNDGTGPTTHS